MKIEVLLLNKLKTFGINIVKNKVIPTGNIKTNRKTIVNAITKTEIIRIVIKKPKPINIFNVIPKTITIKKPIGFNKGIKIGIRIINSMYKG
jgi:hypothetical protein